MNQQTLLVTGAAGFIGSHLAEALLAEGHKVVAVDNFCDFYDRKWKELNVQSVARAAGSRFSIEEFDICDGPKIDALIEKSKPTAIYHIAGMAGVRPSIEQPAYYARINVEGTIQVLQATVRHKVDKFLFASSSSVYGNQKQTPFKEEGATGSGATGSGAAGSGSAVAEPISPYAATKRAAELVCHSYWHLYRLPCFCFRFFTVYGPRLRPDLAIHKFTRLITSGKPIPFFGDGRTARDYTYVDDICAGLLAALQKCDRYRIYNLGNNHPVSLTEMVAALEKAIGKSAILDRGNHLRRYYPRGRGAGLSAEGDARRRPRPVCEMVQRIWAFL
jgi:UDP-glucuronate 4-epimerase